MCVAANRESGQARPGQYRVRWGEAISYALQVVRLRERVEIHREEEETYSSSRCARAAAHVGDLFFSYEKNQKVNSEFGAVFSWQTRSK